jgi:hypothetical protein
MERCGQLPGTLREEDTGRGPHLRPGPSCCPDQKPEEDGSVIRAGWISSWAAVQKGGHFNLTGQKAEASYGNLSPH